jgi:hypothetical protein
MKLSVQSGQDRLNSHFYEMLQLMINTSSLGALAMLLDYILGSAGLSCTVQGERVADRQQIKKLVDLHISRTWALSSRLPVQPTELTSEYHTHV